MTQKGSSRGQVVTLVVVALVLAAGYAALHVYNERERNRTIAESRGMQLVQALTKFRLQAGKYPQSLQTLVPKYLPALPGCPGGQPFEYSLSGGEYVLGCGGTQYDSRTRIWSS